MTVIERSVVVQDSILIHASPDDVWEVFSKLDRWPQWNPACHRAAYLLGSPWKKGSTFELTLKPWWRKTTFKATVIESAPPETVVWLGKGGGVYGQHTFAFEAEGEGTRVTSYEAFTGEMLWAMPLVAPQGKIKRMFAQWLEGLKAVVEKGKEPPL